MKNNRHNNRLKDSKGIFLIGGGAAVFALGLYLIFGIDSKVFWPVSVIGSVLMDILGALLLLLSASLMAWGVLELMEKKGH